MHMAIMDEPAHVEIRFLECSCRATYQPSLECKLNGVLARASHGDGVHRVMDWLL